jgi:glutaredoxin
MNKPPPQKNIVLYVTTNCPYCTMVIHELDERMIAYEEKNIADDSIAHELTKRGGKRQVPYIVDVHTGIEMYESEDIVAYLEDTYGRTSSEAT